MDLNRLEFFQVLNKIESYSKTTQGKAVILKLKPFDSVADVLKSMAEIKTAKAFIENQITPFFGDYLNIVSLLKDIKIKRILTIPDMVLIQQFLNGIHQLVLKLNKPLESIQEHALKPYIETLIDLKTIRKTFDTMFEDQSLKPDANALLKSLNQQKNTYERRLQEKLKNLVERHQDHLSEAFFTERFNRYVVPVKLSYKNRFNGAVVDYSSSGETVYMEPYDIAELTAQIRQVEASINEEIQAILKSLSESLHAEYETLKTNQETAILLDIIFAKAHYATHIQASDIMFSEDLCLKDARHPLIPLDEVVENTIELKNNVKMMIISGSNTGGKTVVLKTTGLISIMALSGLLVPVSPGSFMPFYTHVFADIGDEQSIEQSLSTFSSHMTHIIDIIDQIEPKSLVLFDEIGGGTEPKAGASLARALLDHLKDKDVHVLVTTHYSELKAYAYDHETIVNASVAFNKETLKPTYHLYKDTPGESHAFLIAERLGLSSSILDTAQAYLKDEQNPISDLVMKLEASKNQLEEERKSLYQLKKETEKAFEEAKIKRSEYQEKKQKLTDVMNQKMLQEKKELERLFNETIEHLKEQASLKPHEINEAKQALFKSEIEKKEDASSHIYQPKDTVMVLKYNRPGQLIKALGEGKWLVQLGTLETRMDEKDFSYLETASPKTIKKTPSQKAFKKHVSPECDLRGLRVLEASETLEKYLDDCLLAKLPFARIIHGFGTLAVRNMVKETLKDHPLVSSFRDGGNNEGGQGVTVVYF